jgi:hypothetical protein
VACSTASEWQKCLPSGTRHIFTITQEVATVLTALGNHRYTTHTVQVTLLSVSTVAKLCEEYAYSRAIMIKAVAPMFNNNTKRSCFFFITLTTGEGIGT